MAQEECSFCLSFLTGWPKQGWSAIGLLCRLVTGHSEQYVPLLPCIAYIWSGLAAILDRFRFEVNKGLLIQIT
jgi:hypothetical protein